MRETDRLKRRRWANVAVLLAAAFSMGWGLWVPPVTGTDQNPGAWWAVLIGAGVLAAASLYVALKSKAAVRGMLVVAAGVLLYGLTFFERIDSSAVITLVLPALVLLACVPFLGAMPTEAEERRAR